MSDDPALQSNRPHTSQGPSSGAGGRMKKIGGTNFSKRSFQPPNAAQGSTPPPEGGAGSDMMAHLLSAAQRELERSTSPNHSYDERRSPEGSQGRPSLSDPRERSLERTQPIGGFRPTPGAPLMGSGRRLGTSTEQQNLEATSPPRPSPEGLVASPPSAVVVRRPQPAANPPPRNTSPDEEAGGAAVDAHVRCPVCLDHFDEPVTLSCNHNICRSHVLDLAAVNRTPGAAADDKRLCVKCPKCRHEHIFSDEASVRVNHEMQAVVDMMKKLLKMQRPGPSKQQTDPDEVEEEGSVNKRRDVPAHRPIKKSAMRKRKVGFREDDTASQSAGDQSEGGAESEESATSGPEDRGQGAERPKRGTTPKGSLTTLEARLMKEREQQQKAREEAVRQKVEEFKRQRNEEIEARRLAALEEQRKMEEEAREAALRLERERDRRQMEQFAVENPKAVEDAKRWLSGGIVKASEQLGQNDIFEHFGKLKGFEDGSLRPLTSDSLTRSQKVRIAETMLPEMPPDYARYDGDDDDDDNAGKSRRKNDGKEKKKVLKLEPDLEVERALLDVERKIMREHEESLSRAQMAEIAEQRAREMVQQFYKRKVDTVKGFTPQRNQMPDPDRLLNRGVEIGVVDPEAVPHPMRPTYRPKLNKLQRI